MVNVSYAEISVFIESNPVAPKFIRVEGTCSIPDLRHGEIYIARFGKRKARSTDL